MVCKGDPLNSIVLVYTYVHLANIYFHTSKGFIILIIWSAELKEIHKKMIKQTNAEK